MTANDRTQPFWRLGLIVGVLLAAFILRVATLDRRPLHFDEGNSVYFAQMTLPQLLQASIDTHEADPPGYRQTLGVWIALAGPSPVALRLYSVFYGVLCVAAFYALLRALGLPFGSRLLATSLLAAAAFSIDYSQQAKGYAMGAAMALLSWWMWVRVTRPRRRGRAFRAGAVYMITTLLMLSTHYYTAVLLPMQWLWWLGSYWPSFRKKVISASSLLRISSSGILVQALACTPIAVWTALSIRGIISGASGLSREASVASPLTLVASILREMSAGQFTDATLSAVAALVFGCLAIIGAVRLRSGGYRRVFWFGISLVLPLAASMALQQRVTFFYPRFLLYALPCLCVLISGIALTVPSRVVAVKARLRPAIEGISVAIAALIAISAAGTLALARAPIDAATDFRPLFAQVRPLLQQGDAALGSFIWMQGMMVSYAPESQGRLNWHTDFYTARNIDDLMAPIAVSARRVWSFNYRRNPDASETLSVLWLKQHGAYADRFTADTLSALLFDLAPAVPSPSAATRHVRFNPNIQLSYEPIKKILNQGDTVAVTLNWLTDQQISEHDAIFLHLVDARDGRLVAQNDGDAVNGMAPSFTWTPNQSVIDRRALLVREDLAPGDYVLQVGLYRVDDGVRLKTDDGADAQAIGMITIQ